MKTKYQYIHFVKVADKPKTSVWSCRNNRSGAELGTIRWYGPWRQYCFFPTAEAIYSDSCLIGIAAFVGDLSDERERRRALERAQLEG